MAAVVPPALPGKRSLTKKDASLVAVMAQVEGSSSSVIFALLPVAPT